MDPNQALKDFLLALKARDSDTIIDTAAALEQWVTRGGFLPAYLDELIYRLGYKAVAVKRVENESPAFDIALMQLKLAHPEVSPHDCIDSILTFAVAMAQNAGVSLQMLVSVLNSIWQATEETPKHELS